MDKNNLIEILINIYNMDENFLETKSINELQEILDQKQKEKIAIEKNPNKFWYLKDLPAPKEHEIKTSAKWGAFVVVMLFLVLGGFAIMFFFMAWNR